MTRQGRPAAALERRKHALKSRTERIKRAQAAMVAQVESEQAFDANKLIKRLNDYHKRSPADPSQPRHLLDDECLWKRGLPKDGEAR